MCQLTLPFYLKKYVVIEKKVQQIFGLAKFASCDHQVEQTKCCADAASAFRGLRSAAVVFGLAHVRCA